MEVKEEGQNVPFLSDKPAIIGKKCKSYCDCVNMCYNIDVHKFDQKSHFAQGKQVTDMKLYNKLVRDKIPEIIRQSNKIPVTCALDDEAYLSALDRKLDEECAEYHSERNLEELADILEVVYAIAEAKGCSVERLESIRREKAEKRGGFKERIFLESVKEPEGE